RQRMNLLPWRRSGSFGEADAIAGTPPVGAGLAGISAAFVGVAASAGAARWDGAGGAGRECADLAATGRTVRASTGQAQTVLASTGQAQTVPVVTGQA